MALAVGTDDPSSAKPAKQAAAIKTTASDNFLIIAECSFK